MNKEEILVAKIEFVIKTIAEEVQKDIYHYGLGDKDIFDELRKKYTKELHKLKKRVPPCQGHYRQMDLEECIEIEKAHKEKKHEI